MRCWQKDMRVSQVVTENGSRNCMFMPSNPKTKCTNQAVPTGYTVKSTAVQSGNLMGNCSCEIEPLSSSYQT